HRLRQPTTRQPHVTNVTAEYIRPGSGASGAHVGVHAAMTALYLVVVDLAAWKRRRNWTAKIAPTVRNRDRPQDDPHLHRDLEQQR
ncbi:hypothetical protein PHK61_20250, partial [Actinomycetospora lutea]|uniref:hypothetical protein n=1 Tax=Actinomycetospora lutea TaxID=663604 RepID=UPI002365E1A7